MLATAMLLMPILTKFIPDIIGWLGGDDAQEVASQVVGAVQTAVGSTDPNIVAAMVEDPTRRTELALGLAKIAADREAAKDAAALAKLQAVLSDVASARQQTVQLAAAGSKLAWAPMILSTIVICGFFGCIMALFFIDKRWDERTVNLVNALFGTLTVSFGSVIQYWLGTARDSAAKEENQQAAVAFATDTARRVIDNAPTVAAAAATAAAAESIRPLFGNRGT